MSDITKDINKNTNKVKYKERERCARIISLYEKYESVGLVGARICMELKKLVLGNLDILRKSKPGLCKYIEMHLHTKDDRIRETK